MPKTGTIYIFTALSSLAALLASCDNKSEIKVYRVSKAPLEEPDTETQDSMPTNASSPPMMSGMAPAAAPTGSAATPSNWEPQPLSQMRQASFLVKGEKGAVADISLVSLGSSAGNVLDNVNRWLSQLGQPPIDQSKLDQMSQKLTTSLGEVTIVDLAGLPKEADPVKDGRIIAGMISTASSTLFFKMRGNDALTESQKSDFIKWVAAVCNGQTGQSETKTPPMAAMPPQDSSAPQLKWTTPEGWKEVPPSAMRYASFKADNVDVSIVTFPGDGGSDTDNVNRWRQQIGLPPADAGAVNSKVVPLKTGDTNFSTIDIAGDKGRTIAAWTRRDGRVWFFKATGAADAIEKEKQRFVKFIESVKF
jgi:hypothetical protein